MKRQKKGINAKAWFYSQSFHDVRPPAQTLAEYRAQVAREMHAESVSLALWFMVQEVIAAEREAA